MQPADKARIRLFLAQQGIGKVGSGGHPYLHILGLAHAKGLSVDVLSGRKGPLAAGHVRVHVWNVSPEEAWRVDRSRAPQVPGLWSECPKCHDLPVSYPAWYRGPRPKKKRRYFGFQWHTQLEPGSLLMESDHALIESAVGWLLDHFHRRAGALTP